MSHQPSIAIITGAARPSGLGYNTVNQLLRSTTPHKIILTSRSLRESEIAAASLLRDVGSLEAGREVIPMEIDIDSDDSIAKFAKEVAKKIDHVDCVINNAGKLSLTSRQGRR